MFVRLGYLLAGLAAVLIFCGADGDRRDLSLKQAVQGHWITKSKRTHYYFGESKLVMVDEGTAKTMTYKVVETNDKENWIKIHVQTEEGGGHDKILRFITDKTGIYEAIEFKIDDDRTILISTLWNYEDAKTSPKESISDKDLPK